MSSKEVHGSQKAILLGVQLVLLQPVQRKVMVWGYESYGNLPIRRNEVMDDEHANLPLHTMFKIPASIVIS
jgi:hypothetical protein